MATQQTPESGTVTVACKLPHGLELRLAQITEVREAAPGGGTRVVKEFRNTPEMHAVHGVAHAKGAPFRTEMVMGYALTKVPAAFWKAWLEQNAQHPAVLNKMLFAYANPADVSAAAKDNKTRKSGLEPLDPKNLPKTGNKALKLVGETNVPESEEV